MKKLFKLITVSCLVVILFSLSGNSVLGAPNIPDVTEEKSETDCYEDLDCALELAESKNDISACDSIPNYQTRQSCYKELSKSTHELVTINTKIEACKKLGVNWYRTCVASIAYKQNNPGICDMMEDENEILRCKGDVKGIKMRVTQSGRYKEFNIPPRVGSKNFYLSYAVYFIFGIILFVSIRKTASRPHIRKALIFSLIVLILIMLSGRSAQMIAVAEIKGWGEDTFNQFMRYYPVDRWLYFIPTWLLIALINLSDLIISLILALIVGSVLRERNPEYAGNAPMVTNIVFFILISASWIGLLVFSAIGRLG